jgi:hypothetical protein
MVNITKSNFLTQLADFLHHLPTLSYVAINEEMMGISLPSLSSDDNHPNKVKLPSERYVRCLKAVTEHYLMLQVGVALLIRNPNHPRAGGSGGGEDRPPQGGGGADEKLRCRGRGHGSPSLGRRDNSGGGNGSGSGGGGDGEDGDNEHAYMHQEGMLNQDELEDLMEREEEEAEENDDSEDDDDVAAAVKRGEEGQQTEYTSRVYNFYLFLHGGRQGGCKVTMIPSTVKFLLEIHMDFNRVFREGVPYMTVKEALRLKRRYFKKYNVNVDGRAEDDDAAAPLPAASSPTAAATPQKKRGVSR